MPENLAKLVTKEDVFRGIKHGAISPSSMIPSTKYDVLILDKLYPPKEVIRLAAVSKKLDPNDYSLNGGDPTNDYLKKMGFPIYDKKGNYLGGGDTGVVWKLGTRWGTGKPDYIDLLDGGNIVLSVGKHLYKTGDLVAIANGHTITAIARVNEEMQSIFKRPEFKEKFLEFQIEWVEWILFANSTTYKLHKSEYVNYKLEAGIRQVRQQRIKEIVTKLWFEKHYKKTFQNSTNIEEVSNLTDSPFSGGKSFKGIEEDGITPKLDVDIISENFARLLTNLKGNYGQMLGVFGQWGRGKTFFMQQVYEKLNIENKKDSAFYFIKFHAWKYQDTEGVWAYLYQQIAEQYFTHKKDNYLLTSKLKEFSLLFRLNRIRNGFGDVILFLSLIILVVAIRFVYPSFIKDIGFWNLLITSSASVQILLFFKKAWKLGDKGKRLVKKYTHKPTFNNLLGIQAEIQDELRHVLKAWMPSNKEGGIQKRLLLFVDDLDRCKEDQLVQVIDALRVMLEDDEIVKRVLIVTAVDEKILERAIELKYRRFENTDKGKNVKDTLVKEYLDKLFIACIKLPPLYDKEKDIIIDAYASKLELEVIGQNNDVEEKTLKTLIPGINTVGGEHLHDIKEGDVVALDIVDSLKEDLNPSEYELKKIKEKPKEGVYTIRSEDLSILKRYARVLKGDITPRQLRIFMYRYLLAKDLAKSFNNDEAPSQEWCEYVLKKIIENRNKHFDEIKDTVDEKIEIEVREIKGISDQLKEATQKLVDIVAPY